jgi:predicted Ser/Thr protein kinase
MIIDGEAGFRSRLMHHVASAWPDARISAYDPVSAGHLSDDFSGAGNDLVLLGDHHGDRRGLDVLKRLTRVPACPAVVYFGDGGERAAAENARAAAFIERDDFRHDALVVRLSEVLARRRRRHVSGSPMGEAVRIGTESVIGGCRLTAKLSESTHSAVYLAKRQSTGEALVLKVLRHVPDFDDGVDAFDRFLLEYELIADLDHPNIVRIYDLGVSDDHAYIAMEYLDGGDLGKNIKEGIPESMAVAYLREIAGALARIHDVGILHRDLKPGNIMLRADGSIALIDFGLAKSMRLKQEIAGIGEIFGTPYYMSPEQGHAAPMDQRSDIYSLGIVFYEMLRGQTPFRAHTALGTAYLHANAPIPRLPAKFSHHQALLNRLLAKRPEDRLQSAGEVMKWL